MADQWYYKVFGEEFGPVPFEMLRELVESGQLSAEDEVRQTAGGTWVAAETVANLFGAPAAVATAPPAEQLEELTDLSQFEINSEPAPPRAPQKPAVPEPRPVEPPPAEPEPTASVPAEAEWYCRVSGEEYGPISFEELKQWVDEGRLDENDRVKLGKNEKWRPVDDVPELAPPKSAASPAPQSSYRPASAPSRRPTAAPSPGSVEVEKPEPVPAPAAPVAAPKKSSFSAAMAEADVDAGTKESRRRSYGGGLDPRIAGGIILVLTLFLSWWFGLISFGKGRGADKEAHVVFSTIFAEIKQKRSKGIDEAFVASTSKQVEPHIARLKKGARSDDPAKQHLLWAGEYLLDAAKDKSRKPSRYDELVEQNLAEAKAILDKE